MLKVLAILAMLAVSSPTWADSQLQNWFNDPFFRATADHADCPEPAGPRVTEEQRLAQSHRRLEKGTACWLAKEADCERNSAYNYDSEIAAALQASFKKAPPVKQSSLWVTVQGRVVYIEGCVSKDSDAVVLEAFVRGVPHVQQAIAIVAAPGAGSTPYRRLDAFSVSK